MMIRRITIAMLTLAAGLLGTAANAQEQIDQPLILVATPQLRDQLYGGSVLIVTPIGNGQHIGFILNHPTSVKLSDLFPDHAPSKNVAEPVFLGGPENRDALFALVQRRDPSGSSRVRVAANLYLEMERDKIDGVIEHESGRARFFAGVVVWRPNELRTEVRNGFWHVQDADPDLVLRKSTRGMWEELIKRIQRNRNAITADLPLCPPPQRAPATTAETAQSQPHDFACPPSAIAASATRSAG
jgi:putative transcriptional regulator